MTATASPAYLRSLLRKYEPGTRIDDDSLHRALDDPTHGTAFREWASLYLDPENLLSPDELAAYLALDQSGDVDRLVASQDLAAVQAVTEDQLRTAIAELDRSTAAITKQTETMRHHHTALAKLVDADAEAARSRAALVAGRAVKQEAEKRRLLSTVEELSQALAFRVSDLEQHAKTTDDHLHQTIETLLREDDKLLTSLQKLGWELDSEDPEEKKDVERLREICMRLIKSTVETTRTRLDRLYLESLSSAPGHGRAPSAEVKDLEEEVESLYAEILPVAQMSVEQQHLEPALKSVSDKNGQSLGRSAAAVVYIDACLEYLSTKIDRLSPHVQAVKSHRAATTSLVDTTKAELAVPSVTPPKKPAPPASPVRTRAPTKPATTPGWNRRGSGVIEETPMDALARLVAVNLGEGTSWDRLPALARTRDDREAKADDVAHNAQESFNQATAAHLADAKRAVQLLRDSVLAESPFGADVKLVDPDVEGPIDVLSQEVAKAQARVEEVEIKRAAAAKAKNAGQSEKQQDFLQRWA